MLVRRKRFGFLSELSPAVFQRLGISMLTKYLFVL